MRTTKKLLMIFCTVVLLVATVFSVTLSALVAGEGTSIEEYLTMKVSEFEDFEDGANPIEGVQPFNYMTGASIQVANSIRKPPVHVYAEEGAESLRYYLYDYDGNSGNKDGYIQPILGVLDNIDKTPTNGFVSEFDIAFFSPIEYEQVPKTNPVLDNDGKPVYETDENGNVLLDKWGDKVPKTEIVTIGVFDENGEPVIDETTGQQKRETVMVDKIDYVVDENGERVKDVNGKYLMNYVIKEKQDFEGLNDTFYIKILNTQTMNDGIIDALKFKTYAKGNSKCPAGYEDGCIMMTMHVNDPEASTYTGPKMYLAPDEWIHLTFQFDASSMMMNIYTGTDKDSGGRKLFTSISGMDSEIPNQDNEEGPVYPLRFRLGTSSSKGYVGFDNFFAYQGTTVRDPGMLDKMTKDEIIVKYVSNLDNSAKTNVERYQAYVDLSTYFMSGVGEGSGSTDEANAAISTYFSYKNNVDGKLDALLADVKAENVATFKKIVEEIDNAGRELDNITKREVSIAAAQDFLASVAALIDRTNTDFIAAEAKLKTHRQWITSDTASNEFIRYMNLFSNALKYDASLSRIKTHYAAAAAVRDEISAYADFASGSASRRQLEAATVMFDGGSGNPSAADRIAALTVEDNTDRFIGLMDLFVKTSENDWKNDDGTLENLWYTARKIYVDKSYDETETGIERALEIFTRVDGYFWTALQNEHVAILKAKLDSYNGADSSFIYKKGVCTYVDNYLELNKDDIDEDNEDIKNIKATNEAYKAQLGTLEGDYENVLVENATQFINAMKRIALLSDYADIKPLYDKATDYYYMMDVIGEGIEDYTAQYEALREKITATEAACTSFLAIVNGTLKDSEGNAIYTPLADITSKNELFLSLSECSVHVGGLDMTYEGVADAFDTYEDKYDEYTSDAKLVNAQIAQTVNTTCAARGNWDIDSIIAFVRSLFD